MNSHGVEEKVKRALYRYGYDTRCRNLTSARKLRAVQPKSESQAGAELLDVGCGRFGLAAFLPGVEIVGVDKTVPAQAVTGFTLQCGDVTALPFLDRSFALVSCIDVLENISVCEHYQAIREMVRVASRALLIACPHGQTARECDEEFLRACRARSRPAPGWLTEHRQENYPVSSTVAEQIRKAAMETGRTATVSISYCEPAIICRLIRAAAVRSRWLYAAVNLLFGALFNLLPAPGVANGYRAIILAELASEAQPA